MTGPELDAERWSRVEALFDAALERPPAERAQWVRAAAADESVAAEVIDLLSAHDGAGILDSPAAEIAFGAEGVPLEARFEEALGDRYRIERVLGHGGMATVFLARELKHDRAVVVKVLRPEVGAWLGADRFLSEIQIVARLSHPHILPLLDSGEARRLLFYTMPYLPGDTLRARLSHGPLPLTQAATLLHDIAEALAHAHRHGVIHRDLKPENVLCAGGHAFLMDFGIAKLRPEAGGQGRTADGLPIGTPAYMAPEQAAGEKVDQRADVYSWGLLARELLLGRLSRHGDLAAERRDVPPALAQLVSRALSDSPANRPRDAEELLEQLDRIGATRPRRWWKRWLVRNP